ncbi:hypothetical protein JCM5350_006669 [Sporobolomyces pararoseus]
MNHIRGGNGGSILFKRCLSNRSRSSTSTSSQLLSILRDGPSPAPSSRSRHTRPNQYQKKPCYQQRGQQQQRKTGGTVDSISLEQLKLKLISHLRLTWSSRTPSKQLRQFSQDLGIDLKSLLPLVENFSKFAIESIQRNEGIESEWDWDWETLQLDYLQQQQSQSKEEALWSISITRFLAFIKTNYPLVPAPSSTSPNKTLSILHELSKISDQRFAYETYPLARQERRKIILHVGPTNSGKTYSALLALSRARTGAYAGPLRLLAHEVFTRFNQGKIGNEPPRECNLLTGEEQKIVNPEAGLVSCTVEMFPMTRKLEVGVVDEIQMIGDSQRGSAWTQTLVGSLCKELHLCGEESVVELVEKITRELGDELIIKRYSRLSPLTVSDQSLEGDLKKIRKGDCLVTFSRNNIFMFKRQIESKTGLKVAVAYGGLPPEVREEQARAFNQGEYDVLVASDAVGMGLNLKIRRIVFESLHKWDGTQEVRLSTPQIKQIAGRAGRYGVHTPVSPSSPDLDPVQPEPDSVNGEATTLDRQDLPILQSAMKEPTVQVTRASSIPPFEIFKQLYQLLPPTTSMSRIFSLVQSITRTEKHYKSTGTESFQKVGEKISKIFPLSFQERYTFGSAPVNLRDEKVVESLIGFVKSFSRNEPILIERWGKENGLFEKLDQVEAVRQLKTKSELESNQQQSSSSSSSSSSLIFTPTTLQSLESFHRCLTLYLWLSYRLAPIFSDQQVARELRIRLEKSIEFVLEGIRFERIERGKGSKRNKAKFSSSTGGGGESLVGEGDQKVRGVFDRFGRFKSSPSLN